MTLCPKRITDDTSIERRSGAANVLDTNHVWTICMPLRFVVTAICETMSLNALAYGKRLIALSSGKRWWYLQHITHSMRHLQHTRTIHPFLSSKVVVTLAKLRHFWMAPLPSTQTAVTCSSHAPSISMAHRRHSLGHFQRGHSRHTRFTLHPSHSFILSILRDKVYPTTWSDLSRIACRQAATECPAASPSPLGSTMAQNPGWSGSSGNGYTSPTSGQKRKRSALDSPDLESWRYFPASDGGTHSTIDEGTQPLTLLGLTSRIVLGK